MYVCILCESSGQSFKTVCPSCWNEMQAKAFGGAVVLSKLQGILFGEGGGTPNMGVIEREVGRLKTIEQGVLEGLVGDELWSATLE